MLLYGAETAPSLCACASVESNQMFLLQSLRALRSDLLQAAASSKDDADTTSFVERNSARAALSQSKLEKLRREAKEKEASKMQDAPKINNRSRALAQRGGRVDGGNVSIANRQTKRYQEELERRDRVRKEREEKQVASMQKTPKINKRSRALAASQRKKMNTAHQSIADRQAERRRMELLRHEEKRLRQEKVTMEEFKRTKPKVSKGSAKILKKLEREGRRGASGESAGDRLYKHAELLKEKKRIITERNKFNHTPNTRRTKKSSAAQAETLRRDKIEEKYGLGVSDRLYLEAQAKDHRKAMAVAESKLLEKFDPETGEELFHPKVAGGKSISNAYNGRSSSRGRMHNAHGNVYEDNNLPVHVRLARKQKEYNDKRERKELRKKEQISKNIKKNHISSTSNYLVQRMEKRGDITPTSARLQQNIGAVRQRTIEEMDHPTFRPKIHTAPPPPSSSSTSTAIRRFKNDNKNIYVPSPSKVAKHSNALSREEVIEYRKLQREGDNSNNGIQREIGEESSEENKTKMGKESRRGARLQTRPPPAKSRVTTSTKKKKEDSKVKRVIQLPNRHRSPTSPSTNTNNSSPPSNKRSKKPAATDSTSNLLRAKLLSSRRRGKTPKQQQQQKQSRRQVDPKENVPSQYTTPRSVAQHQQRQRRQQQQQQQEELQQQEQQLPKGWNEYVNDQGFVYYAHVDGRTQWNTPVRPGKTNAVTPNSGIPSREELDDMIRGMGQSFLNSWKNN